MLYASQMSSSQRNNHGGDRFADEDYESTQLQMVQSCDFLPHIEISQTGGTNMLCPGAPPMSPCIGMICMGLRSGELGS